MGKNASWITAFLRNVKARVPTPVKYYLVGRWRSPREHEFFSKRREAATLRQLQRVFQSAGGPTLWLLPFGTWFHPAFQRPHQMARALAEDGYRVLWHEPWSDEPMKAIPAGDCGNRFVGLRQIAAGLYLLRCPEELFPKFVSAISPDTLLMWWSWQAKFIPGDVNSLLVYEMIDDYLLYPDLDDSFLKLHWKWVVQADIVTATSDALREQVSLVRGDVLLLPNGVNLDDWSREGQQHIPPDMREPRRAPVVIGFCGTISTWFDWDLWNEAARLRPSWSFVLVGPYWRVKDQDIMAHVQSRKNMYWLGRKPYSLLPAYTANFDVATVPFVLDPITHACSPIKLFEYMAAGKPVVATPMREILKYKTVHFADGPEAFVRQLETALLSAKEPNYQLILKEESRANTWQQRAIVLREAIELARRRQGGIPRRHAAEGTVRDPVAGN